MVAPWWGAGTLPEWKFDDSPLRLRSLDGTRIAVDHGGEALEIDPGAERPKDDADRQKAEEEIFRTENPEPGVGAMLRSRGERLGNSGPSGRASGRRASSGSIAGSPGWARPTT